MAWCRPWRRVTMDNRQRALGYLGLARRGSNLAIGKEGQNARLAARLTGYKIDIKPASQADELPPVEEAAEVETAEEE